MIGKEPDWGKNTKATLLDCDPEEEITQSRKRKQSKDIS